MHIRSILSRTLLLAVIAAPVSGCGGCGAPAGTPDAPSAALADECRRNGVFAISGTRPENTRVLAIVVPEEGAQSEVELAPLAADTAFTGSLSLDDDGVYVVSLVAENEAGERSAPSAEATFTVDAVTPAPPTGTPPAQALSGSNVAVSFTTDLDVEELTCTAPPAVSVGGVSTEAGAFSVDLPIGVGANSISCVATDACANTSLPTTFVITGLDDLVAPPVVVTPPENVRLADGVTTAQVTASGTTEANTTVELTIDGGTPTNLTPGANPLLWNVDVELTAGSHTLSLVAFRNATRSTPTVMNVVIGGPLEAPTLVCATGPTRANTLSLSGTRPANTAVEIVVGAEAPVQIAAAAAATAWSGSFDISGRADGTLTYAAQAVDAIGAGDVSASCDVVIDRTAPDAPVLDPVIPVIAQGTTSGPIDFTGTGEIGARVFASVDGGVASERTVVAADGTFAFTVTLTLAGNPHTVAVSLVDGPGNGSLATTVDVTVRTALLRPNLTIPGNGSFPLFTNATSVGLVGTRPSGAGVLARFEDGSADLILVPNGTVGTAFNTPIPVPANDSISFCLYSFDASTESDARCTLAGTPFVITNDSIAPADLVVDAPATVLTDTVDVTVTKDAGASVEVSINGGAYVTRVAATNQQTSVVITNIALVPGLNTLCFLSSDAAGNDSGEVCVDVERFAPQITITAPTDGQLFNGNFITIDATLLDTTATSYTICVTPEGGAESCQDVPADVGGGLQGDVDVGAPPAPSTFVTVEVCGTDGTVTACDTRSIIRWGAPEQLSTSVSTQAKATPAIAVDQLGRAHLVWQDVTNVCSTGHLDVITSVSRNGSNRLQISVSRPNEVGLVAGDSFSVLGTASFNGSYTVRSVTNGVVETDQTLLAGAPETAGNIVTDDVRATCAGPDIFYTRFDEAGWSDVLNLSDVGGDAASSAPAIIVDDNDDVHVVWQEAGNLNPSDGTARPPEAPADGVKTDLVHRVIDGLTGAISLPVVISTQDDGTPDTSFVDDRTPALATSGGVVVAAWETLGAANARSVLLSRFNGTAWSAPVVATARTTATPMIPTVGLGSSGVAYVAWIENSGRVVQGGTVGTAGDRDIVLCPIAPTDLACPNGADMLVSTDLNGNGNSSEPAIAMDEGDGASDDESVHVVWSDDEGRGATLKRILHRRLLLRLGTGAVLGPVTSITTSGNGQNPAIAVVPGATDIVVAWTDNSGTHGEFTAYTSIGADSDVDGDTVPERSAFSAAALAAPGAGSFTSADSAPSIALDGNGRAFLGWAHQPSNASVDSEIFAWSFLY